MEFYVELGKKIRKLREQNRITREQFAEMTNISAKYLYEIENGKKKFSVELLIVISRELGVSPSYLLNEDNSIQGTINLLGDNEMEKTKNFLELVSKMVCEECSKAKSKK